MGGKKPKRILLVDDQEIVREALGGFLESEGYEVVEAGDGNAAIEKLKEEPFDVIITDIKMPGKDGMDVLLEAKQIRLETDVIMMAESTFNTPEKALKLGAKDFIHKSIQVGKFIDKIISAIER